MIQNMRDLGGLKTQDEKTIKPHCLIRSAHLYQANEKDLEGVSAIIDLRTPGESAQAPDQTCKRTKAVPSIHDQQPICGDYLQYYSTRLDI